LGLDALQLLHMHKHQVRGLGRAPGKRWRAPRTLDEVAPSIMRKLGMVEAARGVSAEQRTADEAAWAARRAGDDAGR
jgi:hypothetical protein